MGFKETNRCDGGCEYGYSRYDSFSFSVSGQPIGLATVVVFVWHTLCAALELVLQQG
ncbi:MAG: hypothetical protein JWM04_960 [Verrucomicrobiales bacterium]|nr:hypothetical protein [Verrucomicrobiales bacterium]